jgi:hypothetical protein
MGKPSQFFLGALILSIVDYQAIVPMKCPIPWPCPCTHYHWYFEHRWSLPSVAPYTRLVTPWQVLLYLNHSLLYSIKPNWNHLHDITLLYMLVSIHLGNSDMRRLDQLQHQSLKKGEHIWLFQKLCDFHLSLFVVSCPVFKNQDG